MLQRAQVLRNALKHLLHCGRVRLIGLAVQFPHAYAAPDIACVAAPLFADVMTDMIASIMTWTSSWNHKDWLNHSGDRPVVAAAVIKPIATQPNLLPWSPVQCRQQAEWNELGR
jgi:hypothetical protein